MTKVTLVVLAAGLGSRFGGIKQLEPINSHGDTIVDFSLYDAISSGFSKIVFVVRKEIIDDFRRSFLSKLSGRVDLEFICQETGDLPDGFSPAARTKPWGTAHALLAAKRAVPGNFCVINADDFYGRESFEKIFDVMSLADPHSSSHAMIGYRLENTLSENGSVSRGQCMVSKDDFLTKITERKKISRIGRKIFDVSNEERKKLPAEAVVSMNFWGFTPGIFNEVEEGFKRFLSDQHNHEKAEYFITKAIDKMIEEKRGRVRVIRTAAEWMGMTYREDKLNLMNGIKFLEKEGVYPKDLWN
ncbi:MAG: sugar phosphate nucleotidyltransferase [Pyrinomonadaceae bacterium]